ncbi:MAG TPA: branched-chain amino acid aminotransferase [Bacteroidales bacterium]|jgi:branched-chain amino acid aminotransferase|nr:branched-chain amino acid aminotransferase [Bacteroidales bacterium]MBP7874364.1 branched-chain amino acid aminotransferase [Bacteroidales bacterium]MCZ2283563.1 branched-chain amino acid aminotransferase [Bacteroidales bacterium]HPX34363.1 branched-chain amino acid aminotransferase [Bacteroidales bacterium]HQF01404.1 branched-chain amino acid aminotransferase [Bacteroidales bacterium]
MTNIDWKNLPFGYFKTDYNVRCYYRNGKWGEVEVSSSEYITMHMAATCLHYGQEAFEGMKAFRGSDGKIRVFRWMENAKRMQRSAEGIMMAVPPVELFGEMIFKAIKLNEKYVPPYGYGASLYLRPLLIGTGAEVGVKPADEYLFMVFVGPVGPYFKEGFKPVNFQIISDYDRAAPFGTGHIKVGGNYAASLKALIRGKNEGFPSVIFRNSADRRYIDEAGPANFFGIKGNSYITPDSPSILPSITNLSLRQLAKDIGLNVELRSVAVDELDSFEEAGACGTAAVITPIGKIVDRDTGKVVEYSKDGKAGPISTKLYNKLKGIQEGTEEDIHNWNTVVE